MEALDDMRAQVALRAVAQLAAWAKSGGKES
jgi:hypothetical protein